MGSIALKNVTKKFKNTTAVDNLSLEIRDGEFFCVLGPPGAGKTTLLRLIVGLEKPDSGEVRIDGEVMTGVHPSKRDIAMIFQNLALYPDKTVYENIAFPLRQQDVDEKKIEERVRAVSKQLKIDWLLEKLPSQLSGGERQRVAIGRAIVRQPKAYLMDEPLSNLDAKLRVEMRGEIRSLQQNLGITTVYVTHDQEEALSVSDRIAVMDHGVIRQVARPWEIYTQPQDAFVAGFIGATNLLSVEVVEKREQGYLCQCGGVKLGLPQRDRLEPGARIQMALRPEFIQIRYEGDAIPPSSWELEGEVNRVEYLGSLIKYEISLGPEVRLLILSHQTDPSRLKKRGDRLTLHYPVERALSFAEVPGR